MAQRFTVCPEIRLGIAGIGIDGQTTSLDGLVRAFNPIEFDAQTKGSTKQIIKTQSIELSERSWEI